MSYIRLTLGNLSSTMITESSESTLEAHAKGLRTRSLKGHTMNTATQPLKILVVEDNEFHREAARQQLVGHNVTIVNDYAHGYELLHGGWNLEKNRSLPDGLSMEERTEMSNVYPEWDVVLVDLMLPASMCGVNGNDELVGVQMPIGTTLALLALRNGTKKVAVITDMNHHSHPASAMLDNFGWEKPFKIGDAKMLITSCLRESYSRGEELTKEQRKEKPWLAVCKLLVG